MYHCNCQQPFYGGGMMMPQNQGFQGNHMPMPSSPSSMPMTPTIAQGAGTGMGQMGMMNQNNMNQLPLEQSYIENILRLNKGKLAHVYMTFDNDNQMREFRGIIEAAGRDHLIISDPETGHRYLLLMVYLNYVEFDEEIEYNYPVGRLATYSPR